MSKIFQFSDETDPDSGTVAGRCRCKANVTGDKCDQCKAGFHSLAQSSDYMEDYIAEYIGCKGCDCETAGIEPNLDTPCDAHSGQCKCKKNTHGPRCDMCIPGTYGINENDPNGCKPCMCDAGGSLNTICNPVTGKISQ